MVAIIFLKSELKTLEWHLFCFVWVLIAIHLLNNKFHVIFLWRLFITFVWPRGFQKLSTTAPAADRNTIWRYFTLIRLCLALLFIISNVLRILFITVLVYRVTASMGTWLMQSKLSYLAQLISILQLHLKDLQVGLILTLLTVQPVL